MEDMMSRFTLQINGWIFLAVIACFVSGCSPMQTHEQWAGSLIMPLPDGWRELESTEVPGSDFQPWWTMNPIVLEGRDARRMAAYNRDLGKPTKILAIAYIYNDDYGTIISMLGLVTNVNYNSLLTTIIFPC